MADIVYAGETAGGPLNKEALPANNDLVIYKGDYVRLIVALRDSTNALIDLTGSTPKAQLKSDYTDRDPKEFTCSLTGSPGEVEIFLSSATTSGLLPGSYIWDFQITFADGETRTFLAGDVTVHNEVTI